MKKNEYVIQSWELLASLGRIDEGASANAVAPITFVITLINMFSRKKKEITRWEDLCVF